MADLPQPRALPQILGGMVDDYLSRLDETGIAPGIKSLKPGSSVLAMFEAVAQSQARGSQDLMNVVDADDIGRAKGARLDRIGRKEKVLRRGETYGRGSISITDSRYAKVQSRIYAGKPAPIPGTTAVYVADAGAMPVSGQVYLGRGTSNYEGPLNYTSVTQVAGYWKLTVPGGTTRYHNIGESVILAQGGDRVIDVGQVVGTPQGNARDAILFNTTKRVILLDGETELADVPMVAQQSGTIGNVNAGAVRYVQAPAFSGMEVTNSAAIQNGLAVEDDDHYRERIKTARANRSKGTPDALMERAYGIKAPDENSTITSAQLVVRRSRPTTLYIDDGAAYEEKDQGVDFEVLVDSANGGETTFHLIYGRPVARATLQALLQAPYRLVDGSTLALQVGGIRYQHSFSASDFSDISNATAYEVAASVNGNPTLGFNARTTDNGQTVVFFAPTDRGEDLDAVMDCDAVSLLGLPAGRVDTLWLYRNDSLLSKDGLTASLRTNVQSAWSTMASGETLLLDVDGTGQRSYVITDADFVDADTGQTQVSQANPLAAWAAVLNQKLPGVNAEVSGSTLVLTSNRGRSARASLTIDPTSTLVTKGMFELSSLSATGRTNDYTLDRNLGVVELTAGLAKGDRLTAGTPFTRAYLESTDIVTVTPAQPVYLWFVVDGAVSQVPSGLDANQTLTLVADTTPVRRLTATVTATAAASYPFQSVRPGDWMLATDSMVIVSYNIGSGRGIGAFRISNVDPAGQWVEFDVAPDGAHSDINFGTAYRSLSFIRTQAIPQQVFIPATITYTTQDLVDTLNSTLVGATAEVYEQTRFRVRTNSYGEAGEIALVALNAGSPLGLARETVVNDLPHYASVESQNSDIGAPCVFFDSVLSSGSGLAWTAASAAGLGSPRRGSLPRATWLRPFSTAANRYGSNAYDTVSLTAIPLTGAALTLQSAYDAHQAGTDADRFIATGSFHLGPESTLNLVLDQDVAGKSYGIPMFRRLLPDPAVSYGTAMKFLDQDSLDANGNPLPLLSAFGADFRFDDFVLYSRPRGVTHSADATRQVLWRTTKFWNGEAGTVRYSAPTAASQTVQVIPVEPNFDVNVQLPSGAARAFRLGSSSKLRGIATSDTPATVVFHTGHTGMTLDRWGSTVTCTPTLPPGVASHGYQVGDVVYLTSNDSGNFPGGPKVVVTATATEFTWTESGPAILTTAYPACTVSWPGSNDNFSAGGLQVGDFASFDGSVIPGVRGSFRVTALGQSWFKVLLQTASTPSDNLNHATTNVQQNLFFFAIDQNPSGTGSTPPTASWLVSQVNALSNQVVTGKLGGTGSGAIVQTSVEEALLGSDPSAALKEGICHIAQATQDGTNFTLQSKYALSGTYPDWANEQFRLVPTTARNVVDYLNVPGVTGLSLGGGLVSASGRAGHIQVSSSTLGRGGSVQVSGGSANRVLLPVLGSAQNVQSLYARVSVQQSADIDQGLCQGMYVAIDGPAPQPKLTGWTGSTTIGITDGRVTLSTPAWSFSASRTQPAFGGRYYVERHGRLTCLTSAAQQQTFSDIPVGDFVTVLDGQGAWSAGPSMQDNARFGAAQVRLQDGRTLYIGGISKFSPGPAGLPSQAGGTVRKDVDAYDPVSKTWAPMEDLPIALAWAAATLLNDGRVLVCGGITTNTNTVSAASFLWDPSLNHWTSTTGPLNTARARHTATTMSDGQVMAVGGHNSAVAAALASVEVFDPVLGTWGNASNLPTAVLNHQTVRYGNDQLLVLGGCGMNGIAVTTVQSMPSYSVKTWTVGSVGTLATARMGHSCVTLPSGGIFVCGGVDAASPIRTVEIYDPATLATSSVGSLGWARGFGSALALDDGRIAFIGGMTGTQATRAAEIYDPATQTWSWLAGSATAHVGPCLLNQDGTITAAGSTTDDLATPSISTEILDLTKASFSPHNQGTFRVVARSQYAVWLENSNSVAEDVQGNLVFRSYQSVMPGDVVRVSTRALGLVNQGDFAVSSIDLNLPRSFTVQTMADFGSAALGSDMALCQVIPGSPTRLLMKVARVMSDPLVPGLISLFLVPGCSSYAAQDLCIDRINAASGCVVSALDKLDFPTDPVVGQDAYRYNTGLIAEANRVLYGDLRARDTYPGYIVAGQQVDIAASLVRRIQVRLAVRARPGADVKSAIQNAVARVINTAGPNPIPLDDILHAAKVDGVISVVLLSPTYDAGHDTIPVQPYETPRVLDLARDIQVSFIGS